MESKPPTGGAAHTVLLGEVKTYYETPAWRLACFYKLYT
jgi:hypothetical protein